MTYHSTANDRMRWWRKVLPVVKVGCSHENAALGPASGGHVQMVVVNGCITTINEVIWKKSRDDAPLRAKEIRKDTKKKGSNEFFVLLTLQKRKKNHLGAPTPECLN